MRLTPDIHTFVDIHTPIRTYTHTYMRTHIHTRTKTPKTRTNIHAFGQSVAPITSSLLQIYTQKELKTPYDMHGGRLLPCVYDMNLQPREKAYVLSKFEFERKDMAQ